MITYKLKLTGGDVKAVQGDSGHAQSSMVTDVYSHILDESRQTNATLIEEAFYRNGKETGNIAPTGIRPSVINGHHEERDSNQIENKAGEDKTQENDMAILMRLLKIPEIAGVLKNLVNTM